MRQQTRRSLVLDTETCPCLSCCTERATVSCGAKTDRQTDTGPVFPPLHGHLGGGGGGARQAGRQAGRQRPNKPLCLGCNHVLYLWPPRPPLIVIQCKNFTI